MAIGPKTPGPKMGGGGGGWKKNEIKTPTLLLDSNTEKTVAGYSLENKNKNKLLALFFERGKLD